MRKIVKPLVILSFVLGSANLNAQVKLGVQGGVNISSPTVSGLANTKSIASPTFGIVALTNLGGGLMFRPSVNYLQNITSATNSITTGGTTVTTITNLRVTNFEIPLDLVVPVKLKNGRLLLSAAPVITVGLKAQNSGSTQIGSATPLPAPAISFGSNPLEIKKTDWGTRFGVGYEFKSGLQLNANYKLGLTNVSNTSSTQKNHNVLLTAAWFLKK
jgi:hypothetical protein